MPLGPDPASGLFEFAHLQTGAIPERGPSGVLEVTEETGLVFVLLPPGRFRMGRESPRGDSGTIPVHEVELDAFLLSKYEMTQGQWLRASGSNPSWHTPDNETDCVIRLTHPVENVSWEDCAALVERFGLTLPTEAQWEYAARAGTTGSFGTERDDEQELIGRANLPDESRTRIEKTNNGAEMWPGHDDGYPYHSPVGTFLPNGFGLHDTLGNVWEFVREAHGPYTDPHRPGDGLRLVTRPGRRIRRGGSYGDEARDVSVHRRYRMGESQRFSNHGLRPARELSMSRPEKSPR